MFSGIPASLRTFANGLLALLTAGGCSIPSAIPTDPAPVYSPPALPIAKMLPAAAAPAGGPEVPEPATPPPLDPWEMIADEDGAACREELKSAGFKFQSLPDRKERDRSGCGIPHGVVVLRGPTGITYDPPITVDCSFARVLGTVETIVQEEAEKHLKTPIVKIGDLGGFACRPRNFKKGAAISAHAVGSALDLSAFHPKQGQPAIVDRDYDESPSSSPAQDDRRRFLRGVYRRLRQREADLTYIVGPDFNATHHNHFHLDRGGWSFWSNR